MSQAAAGGKHTRMKDDGKYIELDTRRDVVYGLDIFSRLCESAGADRPPVVLVHGLSMSSLYMLPTARRLAERYRVYAPDLPGYGRSQQPRRALQRALTIPQLVAVLRGWLDAMRIGPAVFVGNSMGGQYIVELARQQPERVLGAVLVGPTMDPRGRSAWLELGRGAVQLLFEPVSFLAVALRDYFNHGVRRTFQTLQYGLHDPMRQKLLEVNAPALVVRGEHDRIISQRWAEEAAARLPRGRLVVVPGGGHVTNYDAPDRLAEVIRVFIEGEKLC